MMKRKMTLIIALVAIFGSGIFYSCQQKTKKETAMEKAEVEFEKFKEDIEDLSENDPEFYDKLEKRLIEFDEKMEDIGEDLEAGSETAGEKFDQSINNIRAEAKKLGNKVSNWTERTGDNLEELGKEIKEDFNDLKEDLKKDK